MMTLHKEEIAMEDVKKNLGIEIPDDEEITEETIAELTDGRGEE